MIKTVTPQELRKAFDAAEWNDYTLIETLPDGSEILVGDIFAAIAQAVAAETERCANVEPGMNTSEVLGWDTMTPDERRMWKAGYGCAMGDFAAAIRARGNGSAA